MERRERMCGRCAPLAVALALIAGCGSGVLELLQAPSAITIVSNADHHDTSIKQAGVPQINRRKETGSIGRPRSDGDPNYTRDTLRARARDQTAPGSQPALPGPNVAASPLEKGGNRGIGQDIETPAMRAERPSPVPAAPGADEPRPAGKKDAERPEKKEE